MNAGPAFHPSDPLLLDQQPDEDERPMAQSARAETGIPALC